MFMIAFEKGKTAGGYGDRMVGLVSVWVLAKLLNRPFYIRWTKEDVRTHLDYAAWDAEAPTINWPPYIRSVNVLDDKAAAILGRHLATERVLFPALALKFILNQEIIRFVLKNPRFQTHRDRYDVIMLEAWQSLYTHILRPTDLCWSRVNALVPVDHPRRVVGIQIRGGDVYMNTHVDETHVVIRDLDATLPCMMLGIKEHLAASVEWPAEGGYDVFVTSDVGTKAFDAAVAIFGVSRVIYNDQPVHHLDWQGNQEADASWKVIVDNLVLSQRTQRLYITGVSNYGRVAALTASHADIFDVSTYLPFKKTDLLSKHA